MKKTTLLLVLVLFHVSLLFSSNSLAWTGGSHQKLAEKVTKAVKLPKPPKSRCSTEVDDIVYYQYLKAGAAKPDMPVFIGGDGLSSPKHAYNPFLSAEAVEAISFLYNMSVEKIGKGTAINTINDRTIALKNQLGKLNCQSKEIDYLNIWEQFGIISHYPADIAVPLHDHSANVDNKYHEGDFINGQWVPGLFETFFGSLQHLSAEIAMGSRIDELSSWGRIAPEKAAENANIMLEFYSSPMGNGSGYLGMIKDFENYNRIDVDFFNRNGLKQASDAAGAIQSVWTDALAGFTPPTSCDKTPAGSCSDCAGADSCPGNDHPDDTASVSSPTAIQNKDDLVEQAWDRLAVKKNKKALINPQMQEYLLDSYQTGLIDETSYESYALNYQDNPEKQTELFYRDYITSADIAILGRGFALAMSDMCQDKFFEPVRRFTVEDFTPDAIIDYPVFVVPSGGLGGMENSEIFKAKLDEYVKRGGTLIVFAQQHGYEYSVLPTPDGSPAMAYGWDEDQACFSNSVYIDTYHQILAGQKSGTPSLNVDGYFTKYPEDATVFLRRTANGQPAVLMYPYGQGKVIAATIYTDTACTRV